MSRDYTPRKSHNPALVLGGVFLVVVVGCGAVALFWTRASVDGPDVIQPAGGKEGKRTKLYTRAEFEQLVIGKTPAEVIAAVGRPHLADENPDGSPKHWTYWDTILNPATGKPGYVS